MTYISLEGDKMKLYKILDSLAAARTSEQAEGIKPLLLEYAGPGFKLTDIKVEGMTVTMNSVTVVNLVKMIKGGALTHLSSVFEPIDAATDLSELTKRVKEEVEVLPAEPHRKYEWARERFYILLQGGRPLSINLTEMPTYPLKQAVVASFYTSIETQKRFNRLMKYMSGKTIETLFGDTLVFGESIKSVVDTILSYYYTRIGPIVYYLENGKLKFSNVPNQRCMGAYAGLSGQMKPPKDPISIFETEGECNSRYDSIYLFPCQDDFRRREIDARSPPFTLDREQLELSTDYDRYIIKCEMPSVVEVMYDIIAGDYLAAYTYIVTSSSPKFELTPEDIALKNTHLIPIPTTVRYAPIAAPRKPITTPTFEQNRYAARTRYSAQTQTSATNNHRNLEEANPGGSKIKVIIAILLVFIIVIVFMLRNKLAPYTSVFLRKIGLI